MNTLATIAQIRQRQDPEKKQEQLKTMPYKKTSRRGRQKILRGHS